MAEKETKSCSDCIHYDACYKIEHYGQSPETTALLCELYIDKNDVAPVKHGHWVKEKTDVLTDTDKWIEQISNMVFDVNPAEIASHIQNGTLKEWCLNWQREMNMLIITAPLDYSNSKEREENA